MTQIELKNVLFGDEDKNVTVEVMSFSRKNESHVRFAYDVTDMMSGGKSKFYDMSDAARGYVDIFLCRQTENEESMTVYNAVRNDLRAARTLLMHPTFQEDLDRFFVNA